MLSEFIHNLLELADNLFNSNDYSTICFVTIEADLDIDELYQLKSMGIMTQQDIETVLNKTRYISTDLGIIFTKSEKYNWSKLKTIEELTKVLNKYKLSKNYINFVISQLDSYIPDRQ